MSREDSVCECPREPVDIDIVPLPQRVREVLRERYRYLTPPQAEAVARGLFKKRNILVASPTASGKSLVAYMSLMYWGFEGLKGVYTTPLRALATEKYEDLVEHLRGTGLRVGISTGDYDSPGEELGRYDIIVTTYERLDSLMRQRPSWMRDVGAIVVDEIHMIGDSERGPVIEMILARALRRDTQIVGLSATIGNPQDIGGWLGAETIVCDWRPVPLVQGYYDKKRKKIFFEDNRVEDVVGDLIHHSVSKAIREDYQILVFRQSRREAENTASKIASEMGLLLSRQYSQKTRELIDLLTETVSSKTERDVLSRLFSRGVAFHHAGLSPEARRVVEKGFRDRVLRVVVATPTLAAGVNLPARRVIAYVYRYEKGFYEPVSVFEYKQMGGRAGRPQYDPYGEVVIADLDPETAVRYIKSRPEDVYSSLNNERALRIHLLALLVSGHASSIEELVDFMMNTFYTYKNMGGSMARDYWRTVVRRVVGLLSRHQLVYERDGLLRATRFGELVSSLYIDPLTAIRSIEILREAPGTDLETIYYLHVVTLSPDFQRGITRRVKTEPFIKEIYEALDRGRIPMIPDDVDEDLYAIGYVYAKALDMWIDEVDEDEIMAKTGIQLGDLRVAIDTATWIAYSLSRVLRETEYRVFSGVFDRLSRRLETGVREELLELVSLRGIGRVRGRALYRSGVRTIEDLKRLSLDEILSIESFNRGVVRELCEQVRDARFCREYVSRYAEI